MQLSKKIYTCRKKAGQSQEELAEQIGVSRQSVSKWETGEAEPEIGKLRLLAKAFNVSVDWLLSDDEYDESEGEFAPPAANPPLTNQPAHWVESVPGVIGKLLRQYGWLFGVFTAVAGFFFALIGVLARFFSMRMFSSFENAQKDFLNQFNGIGAADPFGDAWQNGMASATVFNPVAILGTVVLVIGIILFVAGVVLAIILKNMEKK